MKDILKLIVRRNYCIGFFSWAFVMLVQIFIGFLFVAVIKLFMQTYNIASNFRRYLPIVLDYDYYTREPRTTQITEAIMQFYGGNSRRNGLDMDTLSAVRRQGLVLKMLYKVK